MMLNLLLAFLLTGAFSLFHFQEETADYHIERLERKENAILSHIDYVVSGQDSLPQSIQEWHEVFAGRVSEIGSIHKLDIAIYHPKGDLIAASIMQQENADVLPNRLNEFPKGGRRVPLGRKVEDKGELLISTSEVVTPQNEVMLIVKTLYRADQSAIPEGDIEFLKQLVFVYLFLLLLGILLAFVLSNYISQNMKRVIDQLKKFRLNKSNEKLDWKFDDEIGELIQQYNDMVDQLEQTAVELATSERESAWKEMAQQVAHEIKNPLTPMRLTLQLMEREKDIEEVKEMAANLLEEVENLTHIAEAFSRFAQMPSSQLERYDVSYQTNRAVGLYADRGVSFISSGPVYVKVDKEQWSRIMHNLVKNAIQSVPDHRAAEILVSVNKDGRHAHIRVRDNGEGIPKEMQERVFEPNFTTKSSGMGLGLAMVKNLIENFGGSIRFETSSEGTEFIIELPITTE
jgi:nitrogen fixation/metabolism regulation signal transduction histidine kinase